ncbi:MAG: diacylglycerol kinase [Rhodanobacter sp.]|nr:MAG: diacylglycerol kinase [Rhodanobacter sp.]TAM08758.1 MAG: diacylglycerol kinase [Rhodanobacter sp.]TAM36800.1 MAG: diacylglycerol kinase [Rhodanobacter sp.]
MPNSGFRGNPQQLWNALRWSLRGLCAGWRHEASFRLEVLLAAVLVPLGLWLGDGALEKLALVAPVFLVLAAELLNSAIEAVVDLVSPDFNELAGRAKDLGSAATFVLMVLTGGSWVVVLGARAF